MKNKLLVLVITVTIIAGGGLLDLLNKEKNVRVSFLDVGQGDAILLRQGNFDLLVDGGPDLSVLQRLGETRPAWDRTIDVIILTHPDQDHLNGLLYVVNRYNIGAVIFPKLVDKTKNYDAFLRVLKNKKIPVVFAAAGQIIAREQIKLTILAPDEKLLTWGKGNMNSAAIVVKAELPGYSLLLTGDIEAPTENYLVNKIGKTLAADILKVGHHGSKTSTSVSLLDAVKPKMAIISVAAKNMFGHPHPLTLKRLQGIGVERTDQMGTITLESSVKTGEIKLRCDKKCAL